MDARLWKWVDCRGDGCCHGHNGPYAGEFLGCHADRHNNWVHARWWRRWTANVREFFAGLNGRV